MRRCSGRQGHRRRRRGYRVLRLRAFRVLAGFASVDADGDLLKFDRSVYGTTTVEADRKEQPTVGRHRSAVGCASDFEAFPFLIVAPCLPFTSCSSENTMRLSPGARPHTWLALILLGDMLLNQEFAHKRPAAVLLENAVGFAAKSPEVTWLRYAVPARAARENSASPSTTSWSSAACGHSGRRCRALAEARLRPRLPPPDRRGSAAQTLQSELR